MSRAVPETAFEYWRRTGYPDRPGAPPVDVTLDDYVSADRPVYTYFWTRRPPGPDHDIRGAYHGSEIVYFFGNLYPGTQAWTDQDRAIADTMSSYLANYITTGNPNGRGLPRWPPTVPPRRP